MADSTDSGGPLSKIKIEMLIISFNTARRACGNEIQRSHPSPICHKHGNKPAFNKIFHTSSHHALDLSPILLFNTMVPLTIPVTGCSSGPGHALAISSLRAGHKVLATSCNTRSTPSQTTSITSQGGTWLTLDTTSPTLEQTLSTLSTHGPIDIPSTTQATA